LNNKCPTTVIFGVASSQSVRHRKTVSFPTSPTQCNCLTWEITEQKMTTSTNILFTRKFL